MSMKTTNSKKWKAHQEMHELQQQINKELLITLKQLEKELIELKIEIKSCNGRNTN